ncbi:MAG: cyclic nucleotide-binding domain-containing protein [Lachnospiraceae bacterium]|nr:cyclic nucleotide-binding domain-containing protein [Lachnospiraceae bacterium]
MDDKNPYLVKFPRDTVILKEGVVNLDMYKIVQGHAEMYTGYGTDKEVLIGIIGSQSCFGEFGLLLEEPSIYTVVAYSDVYAIRINASNFGRFLQENQRDMIAIMKNMARSMTAMRKQIDLLTGELRYGGEQDEEMIKAGRRSLRAYAVNNLTDPAYVPPGRERFFHI